MNRFETTVLVICVLFAISFMILLLSLPIPKPETPAEARQKMYYKCVNVRIINNNSIADCDLIK